MGVASILLAVLAMGFMVLGFLVSWVPVLGFIFAFGAPVLALTAVVLGGVSLSQARKEEQESAAGLAGVILGVVTFVPALVVAMTCGACNACVSASILAPGGKGVKWNMNPGMVNPPVMKQKKKAGMTGKPAEPAKPRQAGSPPPAFPPPPFEPGAEPGKTRAPGGKAPAGEARPAQPAPSGK
jgi:hypothetical protein